MTEREMLEALYSGMQELQGGFIDLKGEVAELRADVTELKTDVAELKTDVAELKTDVAELKTDVAGLKTDVADLNVRMTNVEMIIENEIRNDIKIIAEGHLDLNRKLDIAIKDSRDRDNIKMRVKILEDDVTVLKEKEQCANS